MAASRTQPALETDTQPTLGGVSSMTRAWIEAITRHDFHSMDRLLTPSVSFRALVPKGLREHSTAAEAIARIESWFGDKDSCEVLDARDGVVADRTWFSYRLRVHEPDGWKVIEQQVYATEMDGRFEKVDLLCSGFRSVDPGVTDLPAAPSARPGTTFDALGADCATLIPGIGRALGDVPAGEVLDIVTDDPTAGPSLTAWSRLTGNEITGPHSDPVVGEHWYIRRKES